MDQNRIHLVLKRIDRDSLDRALIETHAMGGDSGEDDPIIHFVFVHGASHGAWCWYKIITLLDAAGFKSSTVDLTGAGISLTDSNTVFHSDQYNRPLFSLLSDLPPFHKVILVGHSIGGASVTEALCKFTDKISMAIYITASMVKPGSISSSDLLNKLEGEEEICDYTFGEGTDKPPTGFIIKEEFRRHYYYNQSPLEARAEDQLLFSWFGKVRIGSHVLTI